MRLVQWLLTHAAASAALLASIASCNALLGLDPIDALQDASIQAGNDANTVDPDAALSDAAPPGEGGTAGEAGVAACDPTQPPPASAIFVSSTATADGAAADGSAAQPFATLAQALPSAAFADSVIIVDEGTYPETPRLENLSKALTLLGGFVRVPGGVWRRDCDGDYAARTIVASPANVGIEVARCSAIVTLQNLTVQTAPASSSGAPSRVGVLIVESNVMLANVRVTSAAASSAPTAPDGAAGSAVCATSSECSTSPAEGNNPGAAAAALGQGVFAAEGYTPANGAAGTLAGGTGSNGAFGGSGARRSDCGVKGTCSGSSCTDNTVTVQAAPGTCGCGGAGGAPGAGGSGGGASVGVLAVGAGSNVKIVDSVVASAAGGDGAAGGSGGAGGAPTLGQPGTSATCYSKACCVCGNCSGSGGGGCGCYGGAGWDACCGTQPAPVILTGGGPGGAGMRGGAGQAGGAGAGGPSYSVVHVAGANAIIMTSALTFGNGGAGGNGATNGAAAATFAE